MFASICLVCLCCTLAISGCHGFVCEDLAASDSKQCALLKDVTRATAEFCSKQANSLVQLCKDTVDKKDQSHQCSCFTKSQFFVCERFFDIKSLQYYQCYHLDELEINLASRTTTQIRSLCKEDLKFFKVAQDACNNKTSTDSTLPACEILPDNPDTLTCNELPAYLELAKTCKPKLPRYSDAQKICLEKMTETTKSTTTLTTTADPATKRQKNIAPSTSAQPQTTAASTICTPGEQSCISIKFHKTCQTADPKNAESVAVLANGKCNRFGTKYYRYYKLECGGDGIAGVFNCDSTCQNCRVRKMDVALDGQCITKPYGARSSDISLTFNGTCEVNVTTFRKPNAEEDGAFIQTLIILVMAPAFLAVAIFTALLIAYLLCSYSKRERDLVSADSCASVEVIATMVNVLNNVQNSSSSSGSEDSVSRVEGSQLQSHVGISIDEYGVPLEDESSSSSEIMARIPPLPLSARKKQWMRVMTEYSIPANKAAAWARDYDDVHTLVASVEHGNLNGSVLAARLRECDSVGAGLSGSALASPRLHGCDSSGFEHGNLSASVLAASLHAYESGGVEHGTRSSSSSSSSSRSVLAAPRLHECDSGGAEVSGSILAAAPSLHEYDSGGAEHGTRSSSVLAAAPRLHEYDSGDAEHGNLSASVLVAPPSLHECSAFTTQAARSRGRNTGAEIVSVVSQAASVASLGSGSSSIIY